MKAMEWITLLIILALAIGSFISAMDKSGSAKNMMLDNNMHRFILGIIMCAINPVQIPFWFGWSTILFSKKILEPVNSQYNIYIVGIGIGTLLGNTVFILVNYWFKKYQTASNILTGLLGEYLLLQH